MVITALMSTCAAVTHPTACRGAGESIAGIGVEDLGASAVVLLVALNKRLGVKAGAGLAAQIPVGCAGQAAVQHGGAVVAPVGVVAEAGTVKWCQSICSITVSVTTGGWWCWGAGGLRCTNTGRGSEERALVLTTKNAVGKCMQLRRL